MQCAARVVLLAEKVVRGWQVVGRGLDVEVKGKDGWTSLMVPPPALSSVDS
jgi:hypothetical protein